MAPVEVNGMSGYWGKPTALLEWCEDNYEVTYYIAEFWNSFSSFMFIIPAFVGILFAIQDKLEVRFICSYSGMILVGIASFVFHMTLKFETQILDELSMVWAITFFVYSAYECNSPPKSTNYPLAAFVVLYSACVSISYVMLQQPVFHQAAFGLVTICIIARTFYCARRMTYSKFLLWYPLVMYVAAFTLWLIDNNFCDQLRAIRSHLPFPFSGFFQLHAWWHVFTALASQSQAAFNAHMRSNYLKQDFRVTGGPIPFVRLDHHGSRNGATLPRQALNGNKKSY